MFLKLISRLFLAAFFCNLISFSTAMWSLCPTPFPPEGIMRNDSSLYSHHDVFVKEVPDSDADVAFIGDSITQYMNMSTLWNNSLLLMNMYNLGASGDNTEQILWRVQNGELNFKKKLSVAVIEVGTNNGFCDPANTFEGLILLIQKVKELQDEAQIVLLTLLPRDEYPTVQRAHNTAVNCMLIDRFGPSGSDDELKQNVHLMRVDQNIVQANNGIPKEILYDYTHPSDEGYNLIFGPVMNYVLSLLTGVITEPVIDLDCNKL